MNVMAIIGSPRKGGNTELLVDRVIEGCRSRGDAHIVKVFIADRNIQYCSGCLTCTFPPPGTGKCVLRDDMDVLIEKIRESDAFIFGTPNHMRTVSAPLLNFLARMLPLLRYEIEYDDKGNMIGATGVSKIQDKKAAMVISQGDPFFSSPLVHMVLERNLRDFRLKLVGDVISMGNLQKQDVAGKAEDLKAAFELGVKMVTWSGF
ncbi:MAG: flavodoxin family protein [Proteobacteria bacterium]|nr:flavodoxin family protein [Pseudomonadota bacterium]